MNSKHLLATVFVLLTSTATAEPVAEDDLRTYFETAVAEAKENREQLQEQLDAAKRGRINRRLDTPKASEEVRGRLRYQFKTRDARDAEVAALEKQLKAMPPGAPLPRLEFGQAMQVGHVGIAPSGDGFGTGYTYRIQQVVDNRNALMSMEYFNPGRVVTDPTGTFRVDHQDGSVLFWLTGVDMTGKIDGKVVDLPGSYKVTETKRYDTAVGSSNTVFVLEPFDLAPYLPKFEKQEQQEFRVWTDSTGSFTVEAKLLKVENGQLILERKDGESLAVPLERLSDKDQEFVKSLPRAR